MGQIEHTELENHRHQINADVRKLVEKYRSMFGWDVPDIDQDAADRLILAAVRQALDDIGPD
jgi:hypothetical protein